MIIDFALDVERARGLAALDAVREACLSALSADHDDDAGAAALGALPLAIGFGRRRGAAPAARRSHHRRPDREPAADPADDTGRLHAARQAAPARCRRAAFEPRRCAISGSSRRAPHDTGTVIRSLRSGQPALHRACSVVGVFAGPAVPAPGHAGARRLQRGAGRRSTWFPAAPADELDAAHGGSCSAIRRSRRPSSRSRCRTRTLPRRSPRTRRRRRS